ncbi:MAG TPA: outer membrane beta-barrel protein [Candidatus Saccharimonadales bacterium]|nr:outer membrane beta-barrel protein [Candidatus Saccharimonadales bacterium]
MKRGVVLAAVAALFLAASAPAEATIVKRWSMNVGVMGGIEKVDENTDWEDTTIRGARLGLAVKPGFQVEACYDTFDTKRKTAAPVGANATTTYTGLRFVGTFFSQEDVKVLPYVVAGVGRVKSELMPDDRKDVTDTATYGELGFGARVFLWKNLNVRGEVGFKQSRTLNITQTNTQVGITFSYLFFGAE